MWHGRVCTPGVCGHEPFGEVPARCVRRTQEDAERAIQTMNGMVVGQWRVRCGWANHKQVWATASGKVQGKGIHAGSLRSRAAQQLQISVSKAAPLHLLCT